MKVDDTDTNANACICPDCPTHDACASGKGELLYCARGTSACELTHRSCLCPDCDVHKTYGLQGLYYCTEGAAT